ncbi:MAG: cell envelope biogenesis protein OmpA [Bacteroidetes bacterium]|nr:MAG: cell envelope biogenesis protein OmpA [Bacteroidota bacterium]
MNLFKLIPVFAVLVCTAQSCVSPRVVEDLKSKSERCEVDNTTLKSENERLSSSKSELESEIGDYKKVLKGLKMDTGIMGTSLGKMTKNYDQINELYELLLSKNRELLAGNVSQTNQLMTKLQMTEEDLQKKEDELRLLERALNARKVDLDLIKSELADRAKRVEDLEKIISDKDAAVKRLKDLVANALKGFTGSGLTVEERNGKVYVSMEAKLLFSSGSTKIDPRGKKALVKLARVLETNRDVNVMVEGHTDSDKYQSSSGAIKDNWDLSVMRATAVVRILKESADIHPRRLTAAGRGQYFPIDDGETSAAKKKNRRIEVILSPKLDELFRLLETN